MNRASIENKPCIILTAKRPMKLPLHKLSEEENRAIDIWQGLWNDLQNDLALKFRHSQHLMAEKSDHLVHWHQPELIVQAVQELIKEGKENR